MQPAMLWPGLRYRDAPAAIRFLAEAFGFEVVAAYPGDEPGTIAHAELRWPAGGGVMLGSHRDGGVISELPPGTGSICIVVDDPDAAFARAQAAGATIVQRPTDQDYGSREVTARDPRGVYWSFGTYAGAATPAGSPHGLEDPDLRQKRTEDGPDSPK
jgi:uncharacterized glyoxalase superfamily protein PhnB